MEELRLYYKLLQKVGSTKKIDVGQESARILQERR